MCGTVQKRGSAEPISSENGEDPMATKKSVSAHGVPGKKLLRSRRFLPGPPWPEPKFSRRRIFETPSPENREDPAILAWKSGGLSPESDFKTARFRPIFGD